MKTDINTCTCGKSAVTATKTLFGSPTILGFCKDHTPPWMGSLKVGDSIKFYQRIK